MKRNFTPSLILRSCCALALILVMQLAAFAQSAYVTPSGWTASSNTASPGLPPCSTTSTTLSPFGGSGTYTYLSSGALSAGTNVQYSLCGTSFDSQLGLWYNDGVSGWQPLAYNDDNGPACAASTPSFNVEIPANSNGGNYILVVNQFNNAQWVSGGASSVLKYRDNGNPTLTATSGGSVCTGTCTGTASLSMGGTCQTHTMLSGMFEQFNTASVGMTNAAYTPRWTMVGSGSGNVDGSGQAYFNGVTAWNTTFMSAANVTTAEGTVFQGRFYNTGSDCMIGFRNTNASNNANNYIDFEHALYIYPNSGIGGVQIYEDGTYRGDFTGYAKQFLNGSTGGSILNRWIEFKIVLKGTSNWGMGAVYYMRNWTSNGATNPWIPIFTSTYHNTANTTVKAGSAIYGTATTYLDDLFVGGAPQYPALTGLCAGSTTNYAAQDGFGRVAYASVSTGTIANQTISLNSGSATPAGFCVGTALPTNTVYTTNSSVTGASASGLPAGMSGTYGGGAGGNFTISGTPSVSGSFPYTVTTSGSCVAATATGTITVYNTQTMTQTGGSASPTVCKNSALSPDNVYTFGGGATSAGISAGTLPAGITGSVVGSTFVITGTPTVTGSFPYTVTSSGTGGCSPKSIAGNITVYDLQTLSVTGGTASESTCKNVTLSPSIVYTFGGGASSASITGALPAGVNGNIVGSTFVISGTPTVSGTFPYTVTTSGTGGCSPQSIAGTITVYNTQTMTSTGGSPSPSFCRATALGSNIVFTFGGGATSAAITGSLPSGMSSSVVGSTFVISGTPTLSGSFPYTVTSSGPGSCSPVSLTGTITVYPTPTTADVSDIIDGCNGGHTATVVITGGSSPFNFTLCGTSYTNKTSPFALDATSNTSCSLSAVTDAQGCVADAITGSPVSYPTRTLTSGGTYACTVSTGATKIFYDGSGNLMTKITDAGGGAGLGSTTVTTTVDGTVQKYGPVHKQSYLQRHFKISPTNTTSASVCLYMSDAEVSLLHDSSATDNHAMPSWYPTVATSLSNAVVTKFHGNSETPLSNTSRQVLTPSSKTHNPVVNGVTYNNVWEVCMTVTSWSGFYLHGQNVNNTALPVTFLYLTADAINNKYIQLDWATASEINNQGFEIQRSADGITFERIGYVDGQGNSNSTLIYSYDDKTVQPGAVYYYRLKQLDIDGQFVYTEIVSASLIGDKGFVFEDLIPNPAINSVQLGVLTTDGQKTTVTITDVLGRVVMTTPWQLAEGYNISTFDISALAGGTYNVTVYSGSTYTTKRLIVTK